MTKQHGLPKPPWLPTKILGWLLPDSTWQTPLGDFEEYFHQLAEKEGLTKARVWYWGQSLALIPDRLTAKTYWGFQMLRSYYKIAVRNLRRQKGFSIINLCGLSLGLACFLLIALYVADELSYDRFWEGGEQIYRVSINEKTETSDATYAVGPSPLSSTLVADYPEVVRSTRLGSGQTGSVRAGEEDFDETRIHRADSNFFDVLHAPFIAGTPATALKAPSTVVLTESIAAKYFGESDPLGKVITVTAGSNPGRPYAVTGVIEDIPQNSHMRVDLFLSWWREDQEPRERTGWLGYSVYTYMVLDQNASADLLEAKLPEMVERYAGAELKEGHGVSYAEFVEGGNIYTYFLRPLKDIHLRSTASWGISPTGNERTVYLFAIVALAILLLACINYMNLSTARSAGRAKEIGVRKVLGSKRKQLVTQMLTESTLMTALALVPALLLVFLAQPLFTSVTGKSLRVEYLADPAVIAGILSFLLIVGIAAGSYPAFFLSRFKPAAVLKGSDAVHSSGTLLRNGLVVLQFVVSISLIVGTLMVQSQMDFMLTEDLGFDTEQTIVIENALQLGDQEQAFTQQMTSRTDVEAATPTNSFPGRNFSELFMTPDGGGASEQYNVYVAWGGHDYGKSLGLELVAGRFLDPNRSSDSTAVIVNQELVKTMGLADDPLSHRIHFGSGSDRYPIVGVVRDFHFQSLRTEIGPFAYLIASDPTRSVLARVNTEDMTQTLAEIQALWSSIAPGKPFEYSFLDEGVAAQYLAEQQMKQLLMIFSALAIFIACLGLFGLSAFIVERRTKEIAVRKALGASVPGIIGLLSKDFAILGVVAFAISIPFAYLAVEGWLDSFAYRAQVGPGVFAVSGALVLGVAMLTASYQAARAARHNPVDSLRCD